jgi:hypothetical protein
LGASAEDDRGPIMTFRNLGGPPRYAYDVLWGQHYTSTQGQGRLSHGIWNWDGLLFEHMERGTAGKLNPHPFFGKLDVSRVRVCCRQMFMQSNTEAHERFYAVRVF